MTFDEFPWISFDLDFLGRTWSPLLTDWQVKQPEEFWMISVAADHQTYFTFADIFHVKKLRKKLFIYLSIQAVRCEEN